METTGALDFPTGEREGERESRAHSHRPSRERGRRGGCALWNLAAFWPRVPRSPNNSLLSYSATSASQRGGRGGACPACGVCEWQNCVTRPLRERARDYASLLLSVLAARRAYGATSRPASDVVRDRRRGVARPDDPSARGSRVRREYSL